MTETWKEKKDSMDSNNRASLGYGISSDVSTIVGTIVGIIEINDYCGGVSESSIAGS